MRILVNAIPMTVILTGIARYLRSLYSEMNLLVDGEISYFTGGRASQEMPCQADPQQWIQATERIWRFPAGAVFSLRAGDWLRYEFSLRRECRRRTFDIYHETGFVPAAIRRVPVIYTLFDLSLIQWRDKHPRDRVWFFDFFFRRRLPYAVHILTISEYIRKEIIDILGIPPERVTAVHLAPDPGFSPRCRQEIEEMRRRLSLPKEYLLFVGTLEPRKNLPLLIQALGLSKHDIPLVLTGWNGWGEKGWLREIKGSRMERRIFFTGYVSDSDLASLYSGATALIYPSLYEGFGLPILEGMACGCPVVCSNVASLPEVAGEAGVYIDPQDPLSLARAVERVAEDEDFRQSLIRKGFERAAQFTWRKTAERTLDLFHHVANR